MTADDARAKLVAWANNQVGYREGDNNANIYAGKAAPGYSWNIQNQPWCDIFVDAGFIECFGVDLASKLTYQPKGGFSALCSASANYYKNNGAWFSIPAVGDQIFFNVSGGINHTGLVVGVTGGLVTVVEGNASDAVRKNTYRVGDSYINGYGRPNWRIFEDGGEDTTPSAPVSTAPETCSFTITLPVIKYGDASMWVKLMQTALIGRGFNCGWMGADGDFGQQTKIALYQFQQKNGIISNEVKCGVNTWKKLLEV